MNSRGVKWFCPGFGDQPRSSGELQACSRAQHGTVRMPLWGLRWVLLGSALLVYLLPTVDLKDL